MTRDRWSFGDFQTPLALARAVCAHVGDRWRLEPLGPRSGSGPAAILEPTCGTGTFLEAALERFPPPQRLAGVEIDPGHFATAQARVVSADVGLELLHADAFHFDYAALFRRMPDPILVLGNPPWVTNAAEGRRGTANLPLKRASGDLRGLEARTGKANFDVAEWLIVRLIEALAGRRARFALLVKTSTARRVLNRLWRDGAPVSRARLSSIDAALAFDVAVDAGLLELDLDDAAGPSICAVHAALGSTPIARTFGRVDGRLVADVERYRANASPRLSRASAGGRGEGAASARGDTCAWRSGIKHDCTRVLELRRVGCGYVNGWNEAIDVEPEHVYPLLKSTDLHKNTEPTRWLLVPQHALGEDTTELERTAPRTYQYLMRHGERLAARKSSIYRNRPPFSIFGVGPYTFAPWKVAISGLHKALRFRVVGPHEGRPVVLDDTSYFLSFASEPEAHATLAALGSEHTRAQLESLIFWDAKRPITAEILRSVPLVRTA